ncbi:MAG: hypothetical protein IJS17_07235 [Clostridia bacterium]|nr:hypothetical protein [Clostridia bacterium]
MKEKMCCFDSDKPYDDTKTEKLRELLISLIEKEGIRKFCFLHSSRLDTVSRDILSNLKAQYPDISLGLVAPNITDTEIFLIVEKYKLYDFFLTDKITYQMPDGWVIKEYCEYMLDRSSHFICYVVKKTGRPRRAFDYAKKLGNVKIFNLAEI